MFSAGGLAVTSLPTPTGLRSNSSTWTAASCVTATSGCCDKGSNVWLEEVVDETASAGSDLEVEGCGLLALPPPLEEEEVAWMLDAVFFRLASLFLVLPLAILVKE